MMELEFFILAVAIGTLVIALAVFFFLVVKCIADITKDEDEIEW